MNASPTTKLIFLTVEIDSQDLTQVMHSLGKIVNIPQEVSRPVERGNLYRSVHVLVVKWEVPMDPLKLRDDVGCTPLQRVSFHSHIFQVEYLTRVFRNVLGYDVTECTLNGSDPSSLLNAIAVTSSIKSKDSPETLFILYYAGFADLAEIDGRLCIAPYVF